jgi:hypothetical protein
MERTWTGRIRAGAEAEHERFVGWLDSPEGRTMLGRALLTGYRLAESDGRVTVRFAADEPPPIIRFLRNRRFWPEIWEFETADPSQALGADARERLAWRKSNGTADGSGEER